MCLFLVQVTRTGLLVHRLLQCRVRFDQLFFFLLQARIVWIALAQYPRIGVDHRQRTMTSGYLHLRRIDAIRSGIRAGHRFRNLWHVAVTEEFAMHHPPIDFCQCRFVGIKILVMQSLDVGKELPHVFNGFRHIIVLRRKSHLRAGQWNTDVDRLQQ